MAFPRWVAPPEEEDKAVEARLNTHAAGAGGKGQVGEGCGGGGEGWGRGGDGIGGVGDSKYSHGDGGGGGNGAIEHSRQFWLQETLAVGLAL